MDHQLNFYNILYQEQKIVSLKTIPNPVSANQWNCRVGIFSDGDMIKDESLQKLLSGILKACQIPEGTWRIFPKSTVYQSLFSLDQLKYILLFGLKESEFNVPLNIPFYKPFYFNDKIWIKSHSLATLSKQTQYKMELWQNALRPIFIK